MIVPASVIVSADAAEELARFADAGRDRMRTRDGVRMSAACEQIVTELRALARARRDVAVATSRVAVATSSEGGRCTMPTMTTTEYARNKGITPSSVTARCRRGTLPAELTPRGWRIYAEQES